MWGLSKITGLGLGIFAGLAGALAVLVSGVLDFFLLPDRWARRYGALGFLTGVPATVAVAVLRPAYAVLVLADRIATGTYNAAAQRIDPLGHRWPQVSTLANLTLTLTLALALALTLTLTLTLTLALTLALTLTLTR